MMKIFRSMLKLVNNEIGSAGLMGDITPNDGAGASNSKDGSPGTSTVDGGGGASTGGTGNALGDIGKQNSIKFPDGLDDTIKSDPSIKVFIDDEKGEINYANLIKSYIHAQKKMGADKVTLPGKNATEQEIQDFYNKLREPDPNKYDFQASLPEGAALDKELFENFKKMAHKSGLQPSQAKTLFDWYSNYTAEAYKSHVSKAEEEYKQNLTKLQQEWGTDFKNQVTLAKRAVTEFADEETMEYFRKTGLLEDPIFTKFCNKVGQIYKEDTFSQESRGTFGYTQAQAQEEINRIQGDFSDAYHNPEHPAHKDRVAHMEKMFKVIYPAVDEVSM